MVEVPLLVILLISIAFAGLYKARRRVIEHDPPPPNIRPGDRPMTAHPDLTNPPISQPELDRAPWTIPGRHI